MPNAFDFKKLIHINMSPTDVLPTCYFVAAIMNHYTSLHSQESTMNDPTYTEPLVGWPEEQPSANYTEDPSDPLYLGDDCLWYPPGPTNPELIKPTKLPHTVLTVGNVLQKPPTQPFSQPIYAQRSMWKP